MRRARLFSLVVFAALLSYGAVGYHFLPLAAFEGDLTRMSMLPESQFGWTQAQPAIEPKWMEQASLADADVMVIGDSFSTGRVWQTVLTREGLRVRTEHWDNLRAICADLGARLRAQGFRGRQVVLQIVERNLERAVRESMQCVQTRYRHKHSVDGPQPVPTQQFEPDRVDRSGRMSVGLRTQFNALMHERLSAATDFRDWQVTAEVRVARVPRGCDWFSHRRCQDALFLIEDRLEDLPESVVDDMAALTQRLSAQSGLWVTWVVVPNKTTAYLQPDKRFWDQAEARLGAPNLLRVVRRAIQEPTMDIYLGNNTHFSTAGYLLMGQAVQGALRRRP